MKWLTLWLAGTPFLWFVAFRLGELRGRNEAGTDRTGPFDRRIQCDLEEDEISWEKIGTPGDYHRQLWKA